MREHDAVSVLVVEDEEIHRELVAERLSESAQGFDLVFADSCSAAMSKLATQAFQCVLLDHNLPDGTGADFLEHAQYHLLTTPVVAFSTSADPEVALSEFRGGCVAFICKRDAFANDALARTLCDAVQKFRLRAAIEQAGSSANLVAKAGELLRFDDKKLTDVEPTVQDKLQLIYETAVCTTDDGVLLVERRRRVLYANAGFRRLLGLTSVDELPGHPLTTVEDIFTAESVVAFRNRAAKRNRYELTLQSIAGSAVPVLVSESPLGEDGVLCTLSSLREIKAQQRELEAKNRKLSELYDMGNLFVDNVSHEFRTPLTVIKGFAEVIAQGIAGPVTDEQNEYLQTILDRTRDLAQMVDDLLDTSKLRARSLRVDRRGQRIQGVFAAIRPGIEQKAKANQIAVREELSDQLPLVYADGEKVGRIILNLVVNAIKFSPEDSEVVIWARQESDLEVTIGVSDQGAGISESNLSAIFERFRQVGDPQRSSTKGFGLGLNIANELVALNLGSMHVESELGKGSTFSFTLPVDDPSIILRKLLDRPREAAEEGSRVVALRVRSTSSNGNIDVLLAYLASNTYPMDLIFEDKKNESILLVGLSTDPDGWRERLHGMVASFVESTTAGERSAFEAQVINSWPYPEQGELARSELMRVLRKGRVHAEEDSDHR